MYQLTPGRPSTYRDTSQEEVEAFYRMVQEIFLDEKNDSEDERDIEEQDEVKSQYWGN